MNSARKMCIVTGCRAEWGLFYPLAKEFKKCKEFKVQIIATGAHFSRKHGLTYKEIEKDGFKIDKKVRISLPDNTEMSMLKSWSEALMGIDKALKELKPDMVILLGDRYEAYATALVASFLGISIAHIHGGEETKGSLDDYFRTAITKLAHVHFTSTEAYKERVIKILGETK